MVAMVVSPLLAGCASPKRPDPYAAFDEIARRSLREDVAYVKGHLAPGLIEELGGRDEADADRVVREFMQDLQRFQSLAPLGTVAPSEGREAVIRAKGLRQTPGGGGAVQCRFKMLFDSDAGWLLASRAFDEESVGAMKK